MMSLTKIRVLFFCLTGLFLSIPTAVVAGADSGFYLGLGYGDATTEGTAFDESDPGYKVFGGYNFGFIPLVDLAIEASYADFGNPSAGIQNAEVTGFSVFGLAGLSFGPFGIFAKAGVIDWDADTSDGTVSNRESGTDPAYGIGARLALGSFAVRAEYEIYDLDSDLEVGMASISGVYTF
jgi:outer membrane immunogenic protein